MKQLVIVGAGASGMAAAIAAKRQAKELKLDLSVLLLEHKEKIGKKILATGNGRCNLTNEKMELSCYHSDDLSIADQILARYGKEEIKDFFRSMGLVLLTRNGYVYPRSAQSSSVLDTLLITMEELGVEWKTGADVKKIAKDSEGFLVATQEETVRADAVILSSGGKASPNFGSDGSGYAFATAFGHTLSPVVPALVQLRSKGHPFEKTAGVRTIAEVTAYVNGKACARDKGELQLTDYGLSGIPIFQISRYISKALQEGRSAEVGIDFLPEMSEEELLSYLMHHKEAYPDLKALDFLVGLFNERLIPRLLELAGIKNNRRAETLKETEVRRLADVCKCSIIPIDGTNGFSAAQVCAGGIRLVEINPDTMESKKQRGLYLTGEILDVDGICGGYNLHWAWATGICAGEAAAKHLSGGDAS